MKALEFGTFNRFRADVTADDLDKILKASRDTVEESEMLETFRTLLRSVFNEADAQYDKQLREQEKENRKKEGERNQVSPRLVEYPVADVLVSNTDFLLGAEADETWFYLDLPEKSDVKSLLADLYEPNRIRKYHYEYEEGKSTDRLVKFDPINANFRINLSHEFAREYSGKDQRKLLENIVTAEALLEVYLRQNNVPLYVISNVLEQRDKLLRSLAQDSSYSFALIGQRLRDAAQDKYELEISLVVAARALGFNATHISNAKQPDGVAIFENFGSKGNKITLEAKSSADVPSLSAIDFGGLDEHVRTESADGCLLLAPSYPNLSAADSSAANRAQNLRISCWTVNQLADVVEAAEKRKINAQHVLDIVLSKFSPIEVEGAIANLLGDPEWHYPQLYQEIISVIRRTSAFFSISESLTVDRIFGSIPYTNESLKSLTTTQLQNALRDMEGASGGGMRIEGQNVRVL